VREMGDDWTGPGHDRVGLRLMRTPRGTGHQGTRGRAPCWWSRCRASCSTRDRRRSCECARRESPTARTEMRAS